MHDIHVMEAVQNSGLAFMETGRNTNKRLSLLVRKVQSLP